MQKNPHHCSERVGDVDPSGVANLHTSPQSHHGLGGYSKLINGLRMAASGAFVLYAYSLHVNHVNVYIV